MSRVCLRAAVVVLAVGCAMPAPVSTQNTNPAPAELRRLVDQGGSLRVIVTLAEAGAGAASPESIRALQDRLVGALGATRYSVVHRYGSAAILALDVGRDALEVLLSSPLVASISADAPRRPTP